jgi:phage baseplate assembly protein W
MALSAFYRGLAFPFQRGPTSLPAPVYDEELVRESLQQILRTQRGERVMRPNFGCDIQRYVFENNDELLTQLLRADLSAMIARWEPRAQLNEVSVTRDENAALVTVLINYTVVTTGRVGSVSVAFPTSAP